MPRQIWCIGHYQVHHPTTTAEKSHPFVNHQLKNKNRSPIADSTPANLCVPCSECDGTFWGKKESRNENPAARGGTTRRKHAAAAQPSQNAEGGIKNVSPVRREKKLKPSRWPDQYVQVIFSCAAVCLLNLRRKIPNHIEEAINFCLHQHTAKASAESVLFSDTMWNYKTKMRKKTSNGNVHYNL